MSAAAVPFLRPDEVDEQSERPAGAASDEWRIDGTNTAEWAMRKIAQAQGRWADAKAAWEAEMQRWTDWLDSEGSRTDNEVAFFSGKLEDYLRRLNTEDPKKKTLDLPSGTVRLRAPSPKLVVEDSDAFIAWALENRPALVRLKAPEPALGAAKGALSWQDDGTVFDPDLGELVPGVRAEIAGEPGFSLSVKEDV